MELIYFIFSAYGLTQILCYGSILDSIRPTKGLLGELFHCPMCLGFWVGMFLFGINGYTELFTFDHSLVTGFVLGCYSSIVCYFSSMLVNDYGLNVRHTFEE